MRLPSLSRRHHERSIAKGRLQQDAVERKMAGSAMPIPSFTAPRPRIRAACDAAHAYFNFFPTLSSPMCFLSARPAPGNPRARRNLRLMTAIDMPGQYRVHPRIAATPPAVARMVPRRRWVTPALSHSPPGRSRHPDEALAEVCPAPPHRSARAGTPQSGHPADTRVDAFRKARAFRSPCFQLRAPVPSLQR